MRDRQGRPNNAKPRSSRGSGLQRWPTRASRLPQHRTAPCVMNFSPCPAQQREAPLIAGLRTQRWPTRASRLPRRRTAPRGMNFSPCPAQQREAPLIAGLRTQRWPTRASRLPQRQSAPRGMNFSPCPAQQREAPLIAGLRTSALADQGFPPTAAPPRPARDELLALSGPTTRSPAHRGAPDSELADQGSNLDSSEPKSDVLPVTPSAIGAPGLRGGVPPKRGKSRHWWATPRKGGPGAAVRTRAGSPGRAPGPSPPAAFRYFRPRLAGTP